jgi:RNA polymerase sigma-70 factor, ECF subfamily
MELGMPGRITEPTDASELLTAIAAGSEPGFARFYDAYHSRVYAFVMRHLGDPAEASDVLNEVMLEVWRSAARFEGRSRALTWVLGIAHHKALDAVRRRARRSAEELDESLPDEDAPNPPELLDAAQNAESLRRCLEKLSDDHRLVVHLAFFDDLPYTEVARIVDCPVGTVKTRIFHAKRLLRQCLSRTEAKGSEPREG